ncbi:MAG: PadR family transcriptional regulator [bacterium]|nr:PadR family transcriptional regulator [bacterium]
MNLKGTLPVLVLQTLLEEPSHGYLIAQRIKLKSGEVLDFREGTLYPTLHAMENKGLIASYKGTEKGRERRYYQLTDQGKTVLDEEREEWQRLSGAVALILETS